MNFNINDNEEKRVNQALQKNSDMKPLNIIFYVGKSVCKIESSNSFGSGFFIKLRKGNKDLYCLMTNRHIITNQMIIMKQKLNILYDNLRFNFTLELDSNKRFIRDFDYMNLDVIIIEILLTDKVDYQYFLLPDINYKKGYSQYLMKNIIIIQYPLGKFLQSSEGSIINVNDNIDKYEFTHNSSTQPGSSGSPVFLNGNMHIIGIHKQGSQNGNYAHFIGPIIDSLLKDNYKEIEYENGENYKGEMINNKREGVGKLIMKNGESYIGSWYNDSAHGFGRQYYANKKLKYKGNFYNNEYKGYGIYSFENGEYYEGFFRNSMAYGKGIYHYINEDLYEGDFVDNMKHGQGKYICRNGNYFEGQWKNDMQNGYGKYYENNILIYEGNLINGVKSGYGKYYENGSLKYEGNFNYDKYDGQGIFYDSSSIYCGKWKSGKKNGYGEEYFNEGDYKLEINFPSLFKKFHILDCKFYGFKYCYEGDFMNGKKNGNGKLYWILKLGKDEEYKEKRILIYKGEWKNELKSGEGTEYFVNGEVKYKGTFSHGHYNGLGELYWMNGEHYKGNFVNGECHGFGKLFGFGYYFEILDQPLSPFGKIKEYEGDFVHNKKEGFGTAIYKDGSRYQGFWKNDKYHGEGIFYKTNGEYITGHWEDGYKIGNMRLFDEFGNFKEEEEFYYNEPTNNSFWKQLKSRFIFSTTD